MKAKSDRQYAEILSGLLAGLPPAKIPVALQTFTRFLSKERVLGRATRIISAFEKLAKEQQGIVEIALTTAHELSADMKKEIEKSFGKKTEMTVTIDPSLIGGFTALTHDRQLDASVKGRIERFASHLLS